MTVRTVPQAVARVTVVVALAVVALGLGAPGALAAPAPSGGPCAGTTDCGVGGTDIRQTPLYLADEYYHCNPHGRETSPANEDACENRFARTHPHDGSESDLPPADRINPQDAQPSVVYPGPSANELAQVYGAVANKGPYGR